MHVQLLLASALLITTASAVPLEPTKDGNYKPISVIDLPASAPIVEETPAGSQESKETPDVVLNPVAASTPDQEDVIGDKRKPTILIIQRRPLFPFTFTNPFLNRRPLFSRPVFGTSSSEELLDDAMGFRRPQEDPFDSLATRLQSQMSSLWDTILGTPLRPVKNEEEETPLPRPQAILPNRPLFFQPSFLFPKIPAVADIFKTENITGNSTTSETKTVDGHIVTVNKTQHVIRDKDNNPSGFFQIQVVDVRATNPPSTTSGDVAIKEVKPVDNEETGDSKVKVFEIQSVDPSSNEVEAAKPEQGVSKGIDDGLLE